MPDPTDPDKGDRYHTADTTEVVLHAEDGRVLTLRDASQATFEAAVTDADEAVIDAEIASWPAVEWFADNVEIPDSTD